MRTETCTAAPGRARSKTKEVRRGDPDRAELPGASAPEAARSTTIEVSALPNGNARQRQDARGAAADLSVESNARLRRLRVAALKAVARKRGDEEPTSVECERAAWDQGLRAAYRSVSKGPRARAVVAVKPPAVSAPPKRSLPLAWSAAVGVAAFASRLLLAPWGAFWDPRAHMPSKLPPGTDTWWGDVLVAIERMWIVGVAKLGSFAGAVLSVAAIGSIALVSAVLFLVVFSILSRTQASRRSAVFVSAALVLLVGVALNVWTPTLIPSSPGLIGFAALSPLALLLVRPRRSSQSTNMP